LCPEGVEATLYASLMSLNNAAMGAAALLGAAMMKLFGITSSNFDHLSLLLLTCNLMSLLPLPLVGWVPDSSTAAAAAAVEEGDQGSADAADMELGTAAAGRV
jgi:Ca2+/H+ antiporter